MLWELLLWLRLLNLRLLWSLLELRLRRHLRLWFIVVAGFLLFRILDIIKIPPARQIDQNEAWAVVLWIREMQKTEPVAPPPAAPASTTASAPPAPQAAPPAGGKS